MPVKKRRKPPKNDADAWLAVMGLSRHQWAEAASLIGLTHSQALARNNRGKGGEWSATEKKAMTAAWLGLPGFSIDFYNLPEERRATIQAAASVIVKALSEPEPGPGEAPPQ